MISLRTYSTIKIGNTAEKVVLLKDLRVVGDHLPKPIRILGNGSNILMDDRGLKGTVVIVRDFPPTEPEIIDEHAGGVRLKVSAGMFLPALARWASKRGYTGCEYMVGVPGTVGGALAQNAGANNQEFSQLLVSADLFDLQTGLITQLDKDHCGLSYRHSRLKGMTNKVVVSVEIMLKGRDSSEIAKQIELNLEYRKQKTPYNKPSLGSIFTRLKKEEGWLYPGQLIEEAGLKGHKIGNAMVSPVHANYIVNEGGATFQDTLQLIEHIEETVLQHSGVRLKREVLIWSD